MVMVAKVILFGEHAVVYGYRAISMAINLNTSVKVEKADKFIIYSENLNKTLVSDNLECNDRDFSYIINTLKIFFNNFNIEPEYLKLSIYSEIPVSCGLGSSASVIIETLKSLSNFYNIELDKNDIFKLAYEVERITQGKASITDTATITYGGVLEIKDNKFRKLNDLNDFIKECDFLIAYVEKRNKKTADLVKEVSNLDYKDEIFKEIDKIAKEAIKVNDKKEFGELLLKNHELLKKLNISTNKIDKVIDIAKKYSYGAKITGAGGGGCVIILLNDNWKELIKRIKNHVISLYPCKVIL